MKDVPLAILNTSRKSDAEVRALVLFALEGFEAGDVVVRVKNSAKPMYHGRAYNGIPTRSPTSRIPGARYLVILRLGPDASFPSSNVQDRWRWSTWVAPDAPHPRGFNATWLGQARRNRGGQVTAVRWGHMVRTPYGGSGAPEIIVADWREALIAVTAHEIYHVERYRHRLRQSEKEADRAAAAALLRWRSRTAPFDAERSPQA